MRKFVLMAVLAITGMIASNAQARGILVIDDLGTAGIDVIVIDDVDGGVGDATSKGAATDADGFAGDGVITFSGSVGAFTVVVSTGVSIKSPFGRLDLNTVSVSGGVGTLEIMLTDTDYVDAAPVSGLGLDIGGTTGGTVTVMDAGADNSDTEFGSVVKIPGLPIGFGPGAFSGTFANHAFAPDGDFSMSQTVRIAHSAAFQVTSFDADLHVLPEPSTVALVLLGAPLFGFAAYRRRRNK